MDRLTEQEERYLRVTLLKMQIDRIRQEEAAERRRARRETAQIIIGIVALVIAAFAAGHFIP